MASPCHRKIEEIGPSVRIHDKEYFRHDNACGRLMAASYRQREEEAIEREMGILPMEKVPQKYLRHYFLKFMDISRCTSEYKTLSRDRVQRVGAARGEGQCLQTARTSLQGTYEKCVTFDNAQWRKVKQMRPES